MSTSAALAERFLALHRQDRPLRMPNPWDVGSARVLAAVGFDALATTSSGFAATLGRLDYQVSRDEALAHAAAIVSATELPVSADLENGFGDDPADVAVTVEGALEAGLAGCSIEDYRESGDGGIYERAQAADRVAAAAEAAHAGPTHLVLTARAENLIRGVDDLDDTIARLQAFQEAGADVLFAPGLTDLDVIRRVVASVDRPLNVLFTPRGPSVDELAGAGVKRISVGGALAWTALAAAAAAADEFLELGTYGFAGQVAAGRELGRRAFG